MRPNRHTPAGFSSSVLLMGLAVAQAVATVQVWQSNHLLHAKMQAVLQGGFLTVPNAHVLPSLKTAAAALCGGLFYTLSLGAGLTLGSMALARLLPRNADAGRLQRFTPLALWTLFLVLINSGGFDLYVNLYFVLIPPLVFAACRRGLPAAGGVRGGIFHLLPVIVLALLWFSQFDAQMFIDIRDRLLLSNPVGRRINDFYYRYTLYPAEVFKSLSQKMIRTAGIELLSDPARRRSAARVLVGLDWLPVSDRGLAELVIRGEGERLALLHRDRSYVTCTFGEWSSRPAELLEAFSAKTDRHALFRQLTYYGLLLGFPVLLYVGLHTLLRLLFGVTARPQSAAIAASVTCLLLGAAVWFYFQQGRTDVYPPHELPAALASARWQSQVAALRQCRNEGVDVLELPSYRALKVNPNIAVRYWLAEALAVGKHPETVRELKKFLDDPSINVRTRACEILAQRKERAAVGALLERMDASQEWYFQWYAYKALKALGWKQTLSN